MKSVPVKAGRRFGLFAPFYDLGFSLFASFAGGERKLRETLIDLAKPLAGSRVLELFAGTASLSISVSGCGAKVVATDLSSPMLRVAKEKAAKGAAAIDLVMAEASFLPFGANAFDTVIISLGLHELSPNRVEPVLAEVNRVLKKDGRLVILDFHRAGKGGSFYQSLFFTFVQPDTAWEWLKIDIQTLLRKSGFGAFKRSFAARAALQYITVSKVRQV